jgi:hypothetical protein
MSRTASGFRLGDHGAGIRVKVDDVASSLMCVQVRAQQGRSHSTGRSRAVRVIEADRHSKVVNRAACTAKEPADATRQSYMSELRALEAHGAKAGIKSAFAASVESRTQPDATALQIWAAAGRAAVGFNARGWTNNRWLTGTMLKFRSPCSAYPGVEINPRRRTG